MITGTITSVKKVDESLECVVDFGSGLVEPCILQGAAGSAEWPIKGDEVTVDISDEENVIVALFRPLPDGLGVGEKWLFSRNENGDTQASIKLKSNGEIVLNDGTDFGVAFAALKTGFDAIVTYINALVLPLNVPGGVAGPPAVKSTASIDSSKVEKVRI